MMEFGDVFSALGRSGVQFISVMLILHCMFPSLEVTMLLAAALLWSEIGWYMYTVKILYPEIALREYTTNNQHPFSAKVCESITRCKIQLTKNICRYVDYNLFIANWFRYRPSDGKACDEGSTAANLLGLKRENIFRLLCANYYSKDPRQILPSERREIEAIITCQESCTQMKWQAGFNSNYIPYKHSIENLRSVHQPWLLFVLCLLLEISNRFILYFVLDFRRSGLRHNGMKYWVRHSVDNNRTLNRGNDEKKAIVFIHGIGLGLIQYVLFLYKMLQTTTTNESSEDMFLVEIPFINMIALGHRQVFSMKYIASDIKTMLNLYNHNHAHFISHSFGTFVLSLTHKTYPTIVQSATFMDPVNFGLFKSNVVVNFVYRKPNLSLKTMSIDKLLLLVRFYLISRNYNIQHTLCRNFVWYDYNLFAHELPHNSTIILSEKDSIVPVGFVVKHLEHAHHTKPNIVVLPRQKHGQFLIHNKTCSKVVQVIKRAITAAGETGNPHSAHTSSAMSVGCGGA